MPLTRCMSCQQRLAAKPVGVYWAWNRADGERVAHRSVLCDGCFREHVGLLMTVDTTVDELTCPTCGIVTETDYDAVYGTIFVPGFPQHVLEAPFCGACAATYRVWVLSASTPLEDRRGADVGPPTRIAGIEVLRAMGITPRAS